LEVKYQLNNLVYDQFGRPSGVLLLQKQPGSSAHDLVYDVRRKLKFDKVGHAGALDTFSSGLMLILVGKATKFSDQLMGMDKEYKASMILGVKTETQDIEGEILAVDKETKLTEEQITKALAKFMGGYEQFVSIYSSVKVEGKKLRKVLRDPRYLYSIVLDEQGNKFIDLIKKETGLQVAHIQVPKRNIKIEKIEVVKFCKIKSQDLPYKDVTTKIAAGVEFINVEFVVHCSKGTYIRQLAEDIGDELGVPASLIALERTKIGSMSTVDCVDLNDIAADKEAQTPFPSPE
jgi:tRNA pseudouridine55 synthase